MFSYFDNLANIKDFTVANRSFEIEKLYKKYGLMIKQSHQMRCGTFIVYGELLGPIRCLETSVIVTQDLCLFYCDIDYGRKYWWKVRYDYCGGEEFGNVIKGIEEIIDGALSLM